MDILETLKQLPKQVVLTLVCLSEDHVGPSSYMPDSKSITYPAQFGVSIDEMPLSISENIETACDMALEHFEIKMKNRKQDNRTWREKSNDYLIYRLYEKLKENNLVKDDDYQFSHAKDIFEALPTIHETEEYYKLR